LRHEIRLEGFAFALRPAAEGDAPFIFGLRSDPVLGRFVHATTPEGHRRWLSEYFERAGDYYFIVERLGGGAPEGTVGIYNLDETGRSAEWGRWILRRESLGAVESVWLAYRVAFELLDREVMYARTLRRNDRVIAFHDSCGCVRNESGDASGGEFLEHRMTRADWETAGPALAAKAARLARALATGDSR